MSVWDSSTASVENSTVTVLRTAWRETEKTALNITNSKLDQIEASGGATLRVHGSTVSRISISGYASAWFTYSSVMELLALKGARVWLIDSHYGSVEARDNATVLVGWHLPLLGVLVMPHAWHATLRTIASSLFTAFMIALPMASLITLYVLVGALAAKKGKSADETQDDLSGSDEAEALNVRLKGLRVRALASSP